MILYFADRNLDIQATASTGLPDGIRILEDKKTESIETGSKTFTCTLLVEDDNSELIRNNCTAGNFLLRSADDGNEFYTIIETENNTLEGEYEIYAEDAGLNFLNTQVPEYEADARHNMAWYVNYYLTRYAPEWSLGLDESPSNTLQLKLDGEDTLTARLLEIADKFGCEIGYSYEISGLVVTDMYVDIYSKRGNGEPQTNLYTGKEIRNITPKHSVADLATAFDVKGGTEKGKKKPITLSGANYSSDGTTTHSPAVATDDYQISGTKVICKSAMQNWSSKLDPDGLLVRPYTFDTLNKKDLFEHAVTELGKVINGELSYDVEFNLIPDDVRLGDYVNIVDDNNEIYITARVLKLERSVIDGTQSAELGEYAVRDSGISERLLNLAAEFRQRIVATTSADFTSSNGETFTSELVNTVFTVTVTYSDNIITSQTELEDVFGDDVGLVWYKDGTALSSSAAHVISNNGFTLSLIDEPVTSESVFEVRVVIND